MIRRLLQVTHNLTNKPAPGWKKGVLSMSPTHRSKAGVALMALALLFLMTAVGRAPAQAPPSYTKKVLYDFNGAQAGGSPNGSLLRDKSGNLYGTTYSGGSPYNGGILFKISSSGEETVLYTFQPLGTDGANPEAGLIQDSSGNFYGTTAGGGTYGYGTVFKLSPSHKETILYSFQNNGKDGINPASPLVRDSSGNLYGTTPYGGTSFEGTLFKISPSGKETILHNFSGTDGEYPANGLLLANNLLYGSTNLGGNSTGNGVLFKMTLQGKFTVLHEFSGSDGALPIGQMIIDSSGNLYGATQSGGYMQNSCIPGGCGTVYKLSAAGKLTVYEITQGTTSGPAAGVVRDSKGNFYGTTSGDGQYSQGSIFKLNSRGTFTTLFSFNGNNGGDGSPNQGIILDNKGNIYGATAGGGTYKNGTLFEVSP